MMMMMMMIILAETGSLKIQLGQPWSLPRVVHLSI